MAVTAAQVQELRKRTDAPMMECKKILEITGGDIEKAIDEMRKRQVMKAGKIANAGRISAEGRIAIKIANDNKTAVMLEINCETDFVARGDELKEFAVDAAEVALANKAQDAHAVLQAKKGAQTIDEIRQALVARIGENINIRRVIFIESAEQVAGYLHGDRIGVLVALKGDEQLGKDLAMHIAASQPQVVAPTDVSEDMINKEKEIYTAQAAESGKPQEIIQKMIQGRIQKFLGEISLLGQPFVKNPDVTVEKLLKEKNATVYEFKRFEVGEGIEKKVDNFVEEVMAQARGK